MSSMTTTALAKQAENTAVTPTSTAHRIAPVAIIAGLPSSWTYFCTELARELVTDVAGECEIIVLNDVTTALVERLNEVGRPVIFLSEVPNAAVVDFISKQAAPLMVVSQSFAAAMRDFMAVRSLDAIEAARTFSLSQIGVDALRAIPRCAEISPEAYATIDLLSKAIAECLGLQPLAFSDRGVPVPPLRSLSRTDEGRQVAEPDLHRQDAFIESLGGLYTSAPGRLERNLEIPADAFIEARAPFARAGHAIDLVGPARCLTFGPYFYLPPGNWKASFRFETKDNLSTNELSFDIFADKVIKYDQIFSFSSSGKYELSFNFTVSDPFVPFEFRSFLRRGSIGGSFTPLSLTLDASIE